MVSYEITDWYWRAFLPSGSNRDHGAVNVSGPNGVDISGLDYPKTLLAVAGCDPIQDWRKKYYEWLRKSGKDVEIIEYPNMIHAFQLFPILPEASQFLSDFNHFVKKQVAGS
ncbi:gibberellin receptor GID1 [Vigna unguiculata]|uniref:Gibberellin receptor GID1 n=1 Tax=Vigna unguiculata TaxID=3917 RepID=A0A4D6M4X0_VIGUN|nr:gibberellin receptor GID1 [Vigna unguiculata]